MPIGYGCMGQTHSYGMKGAENEMIELLQYAKETGYVMFDTAPAYGPDNERYLGTALKDCREDVLIATKFGILHMPEEGGSMDLDSSHDSTLKQVDESLRRAGSCLCQRMSACQGLPFRDNKQKDNIPQRRLAQQNAVILR